MRAIILAIFGLLAGSAAADVQQVVTGLPGNQEFEAPDALQNLQEGVVWLDLTIAPTLAPSIEWNDGTYSDSVCKGYGPVEGVKAASVRTGSNHIILDVRPGSPEQYGANLVSCDYAPQRMTNDDSGYVTRIKGCYFAHATSIPTAVWWILNPFPAGACGFGD